MSGTTGDNLKWGGPYNINYGDVYPYKITDAELERLILVMEECAEVQQVIGKIIRHGFESFNPFDPKKVTNRRLLEQELGDLVFATEFLADNGDVNVEAVILAEEDKRKRVRRYLHYNKINTENES